VSQSFIIAPQQGAAFEIKRGQSFTITDVEGAQVADVFCVSSKDTAELLSPLVTADVLESLRLHIGDTLYSNKYNPMLTITTDDVGEHDLFHPCCRSEMYAFFYKSGAGHRNCLDNLNENLARFGVPEQPIIQPLNVFMCTHINRTVRSVWKRRARARATLRINKNDFTAHKAPRSRAGDALTLRAEMDLYVGIAACSVSESNCNGGRCTPLKVNIT
jgi:uncharacterized protein YcgI (DUF1989 family)